MASEDKPLDDRGSNHWDCVTSTEVKLVHEDADGEQEVLVASLLHEDSRIGAVSIGHWFDNALQQVCVSREQAVLWMRTVLTQIGADDG